MPAIIEVIKNGDEDAREIVCDELMQLARLVDEINDIATIGETDEETETGDDVDEEQES